MTTTHDRATPSTSRSHRRRRGPAHANGHGRKRSWLLPGGLTALAVFATATALAVHWTPAGTSEGDDGPAAAATPPSQQAPDRSAKPSVTTTGAEDSEKDDVNPSGTDDPSPGPSSSASSTVSIPPSGPGTFTTATGGSKTVGQGSRLLRYEVVVEDGLTQSAADVAGQVEGILADPRGWTADGESSFRRVSGGTPDFVVRLATPATVDKICGRYGLDTGGEVNCSVGKDVVVNLKRWLLATPVYADDVDAYRALIINHEVGHFLGHGHVTCPGAGKPAPAMMQQIKGMHGCTPNVWPYDTKGRLITGPAVP
ncbi:DUF3152 domain-containing protein [Streptomyces sp. NPDC093544]|uniref:DUF3152 domain-containing protein n=1 Tax=Streptomyces sp. NPDC093544 TaxID=3155200 RepID=UPI00341DD888